MINATTVIIAATVLVSIKAFKDPVLKMKGIFNPYAVYHRKEWWRLLTGGFLHADWMHLIFNMYALYIFGYKVEFLFNEKLGSQGVINYVLFYVVSIVASSIYSLAKHKDNPSYNALGASGAVSAVIFACIIMQPVGSGITIMFMPPPVFGIAYLIYSYYMAKKSADNIGHDAHFWGGVFGLVFPIIIRPAYFGEFIDALTNIL